MKPHRLDSMVMATHKAEGGVVDEGMEGEPNHALMSAAEDLIRAIHMKDIKATAEALEACHEICNGSGYEDSMEGQE